MDMLSTENQIPPRDLLPSLRAGLDAYIQSRRERVPAFIEKSLSLQNCAKVQARHFVKDVVLNPINTLWAIPYVAVRKVLEAGEKLGWEGANILIPAIPRSARTSFHKEMERTILVDLFGLDAVGSTKSELAHSLESRSDFKSVFDNPTWSALRAQIEGDVRACVSEYCNVQNGFNDLACSGGIVIAAQYFFGDRSLDLFAMGRRWAALWSHQRAVTKFPLGHKLGKLFYRVVPAPPPTSKEVYLATGIALGALAFFSTVVSVFGFPARNALGFQRPQIDKLIQSIEDKILLRLTKTKI